MSLKKKIEKLIPKSILYRYTKWKTEQRVKDWKAEGSPHFTLEEKSHQEKPDGVIGIDLPATKEIKNKTIHGFRDKFGLDTFVETGTFLGDMVEEQKPHFKTLYSIELNEALWINAKKRFRNDEHIQLLCGDSGEVLHALVPTLKAPAIFWLDGHYSGGITAMGILTTPIIKELEAVAKSPFEHVVLIDDARFFNGEDDYPTVDFLQWLATKLFPTYGFEVSDDIVRIYPPLAS
jgi:hypothetical protein